MILGAFASEPRPSPRCDRDGHSWTDWSFFYGVDGAVNHIETRCCKWCLTEDFRPSDNSEPRPT